MSKIGDLIRLKRTENKISQQELADKVNISYAYMCKIEKGKNIPSLDLITKIAAALKLPLNTFAFNDEHKLTETIDEEIHNFVTERFHMTWDFADFINKSFCESKYDLRLLCVNDNDTDLFSLLADVVKNRLKAYSEKEEKTKLLQTKLEEIRTEELKSNNNK